ncbi:MAG: hypothetical protein R2733_07200 [Acidimicrobiales bacterium]
MTPSGKNDTPPKGEQRRVRRSNREWKSVDPATSKSRGAKAFVVSPFARFARAHGLSVAGDALVTISLADSFFFSLDPNDARYKVALYLILTVAPFGLIAPWLGPAIDRLKGGHRYMVIGSAVVRATLALLMALNTDSLVMFPLAFGMLVMGKAYHVAKSAMVPTLVPDETRLVQANSRLSIITALSAAVAGIPGVLLLTIGGASWTLYFDVLIFLAAAALAMKIPATKVASEKANETERHELRGNNIVLAASAMGYMRAVVGFLTMLLAFELRGGVDPGPTATGVEIGHRIRELTGLGRLDLSSGGAPAWHFGVVLAFTGLGGLGGAVTSPRLRAMVKEEKILAGSLAGVGVAGVLASLAGGLVGAATIAFAVGVAGGDGEAIVRCHRAARRTRSQSRSFVRQVRESVPVAVGVRRRDPRDHPDPGPARVPRAGRHRRFRGRQLLPRARPCADGQGAEGGHRAAPPRQLPPWPDGSRHQRRRHRHHRSRRPAARHRDHRPVRSRPLR